MNDPKDIIPTNTISFEEIVNNFIILGNGLKRHTKLYNAISHI